MPQQGSRLSFVFVFAVVLKRGVSVAAHRIILSRRRGGVLSIHFVAKRRIEWRDERSTCSAYTNSLEVLRRRSSI